MKILFLTKYTRKGASSRYRSYNYQKWFEKEGVEAVYSPLFNDLYFRYLHGNVLMKNLVALWCMVKRVFYLFFHAKKYDHVVIEYELFPKLPLGLELFCKLCRNEFTEQNPRADEISEICHCGKSLVYF